jgi:mono/diheme cytochrome c family protein
LIPINARPALACDYGAACIKRRAAMKLTGAVPAMTLAAALCAAAPAFAADSANGKRLAEHWCAACHVVDGNTPRTMQQGPPSFRVVAHGKQTKGQLRAFLTHPHGGMPDLALSRREIADLLAYIATFR